MLNVLVGAGIGAAWGYFGQCSPGTCPLTSTWWRGAIYGSVLGLLVFLASTGSASALSNPTSRHVTEIRESQFTGQVTEAAQPVVVEFYATWCGVCRRLSPILERLAEPLAGKVRFVKVDVDKAPALADRYEIEGVPTLLFVKGGKVVDVMAGLPRVELLEARLRSFAGTEPALTPAR